MTTAKNTQPGEKTTEFWLSVLILVAATVLRFTHDISMEAWGIAVGLQGAGYSLSRGIAKS